MDGPLPPGHIRRPSVAPKLKDPAQTDGQCPESNCPDEIFSVHHPICVMKNLKFSVLLALALISLGGSLRAEFLYVSYGPGLLSFRIDNQTGSITALPGSPLLFAEGVGPLVLDRRGRFLYASTGGSAVDFGPSGIVGAAPARLAA